MSGEAFYTLRMAIRLSSVEVKSWNDRRSTGASLDQKPPGGADADQ